jgi:hypothetical protein
MRILRSLTRRGFNVGTAGYFTVLRPNTWFAASRLEQLQHPIVSQSKAAGSAFMAGQKEQGGGLGQKTTISFLSAAPGARERLPKRAVFAVLAAIVITLVLLRLMWVL